MNRHNKTFSQLAILVLFMGYWLFVWKLERVDFSQDPPALLRNIIEVYPLFGVLIPRLTFVFELFSPRVLRHFIPVILGWWLAREAIVRFLESFYDLADRSSAVTLMSRLVGDLVRQGRPLPVNSSSFGNDRLREPLLRIGGPGRIIVNTGDAVITERNGRFQRVLGPGEHQLGHFEYPFSIVDVRPQEKAVECTNLITKDGIQIAARISISFKVNPGNEMPSREQPFPFDYMAVRNVAYAEKVIEGGLRGWDSIPTSAAGGQLRDLIAEYNLDDFIYSERTGVHIHQLLAGEMERRTRDSVYGVGIQIISARLGAFRLPDRVTRQHIDYWRSGWDTERKLREAEGEAQAIEEMELARAEAEAIMIRAILEGLKRARQSGAEVEPREIVALRLIEVLETLAQQSQEMASLPEWLMPILGGLRKQIISEKRGGNPLNQPPLLPSD